MSLMSEVGKVLGALGRWLWGVLTTEPPRPTCSDLIVQQWSNGSAVPDSLKFTVPDMQGNSVVCWPNLSVLRYEKYSTVFRVQAWPKFQSVPQVMAAIPLIESVMGATIWKSHPVGDGNSVDLWVGEPPSFDDVIVTPKMQRIYPANTDWSVYLGWNIDGRPVTLKSSSTGGLLISGASGSGKTELLRRIIAELSASGAWASISDFKGGGDYRSFDTAANPVICDDLEATVGMLESAVAEMSSRYEAMKTMDVVDFWEADIRPSLRIVVIDEAQECFTTGKGVPKERQQLADRAITLVESLVKRGRAAGFLTILSTQRPDATNSIPSVIRDVIERRISGRQVNSSAVTMALGPLPDDVPRPDDKEAFPPDCPGRMILVGQEIEPVIFQAAPCDGNAVVAGGGVA